LELHEFHHASRSRQLDHAFFACTMTMLGGSSPDETSAVSLPP
jgi:hypothetical protein